MYIGAPVTSVSLVYVPVELIESEPMMDGILPGIAHGSLEVQKCSDRIEQVQHLNYLHNRERFASLAALFGLVGDNSDLQFHYTNDEERKVYSFDHGECFPNGEDWTIEFLRDNPPPMTFDRLVDQCCLSQDEYDRAALRLNRANNNAIATSVASPPEEWGISIDERIYLAEYLSSRRDAMLRDARSRR